MLISKNSAFFLSFFLFFVVAQDRPKLVFVMTLFRHGDRSPLNIPTKSKKKLFFDPPNKIFFLPDYNYIWKDSPGTLTKKGIEQSLVTGKELRKIYVEDKKFFDPQNEIDQIYFETGNIRRTMRTANSIIFSIFEEQLANSTIPLLPIITHSFYDWKLNPFGNCKNIDEYKKTGKKIFFFFFFLLFLL